jgi:hypothetical protein
MPSTITSRWDSEVIERDPGGIEVDPVAVEGNALVPEQLPLPLPHREAAVGADDPPPGDVVGVLAGREDPRREPRRPG